MTSATTRAVLDANVYVRASVEENDVAREWTMRLGLSVRGHAPDVVWPELTNALRNLVTGGVIARDDALAAIELVRRLPVELHPGREIADHALDAALRHGLTAYDATYLVLAEALGATLVTFDTDFVGVYDRLELLT